jgi:transcriptional regulator with XRE-family HTH domain
MSSHLLCLSKIDEMIKLPISALNIRYFLWKKEKLNREKWLKELMRMLDCNKVRAKQLLLNDLPTQEEEKKAAGAFGRSEEDVTTYLFLDDKVDVLKENLEYLFESIEQKHLAEEIGVTKDAVSKWKLGKQNVSRKNLAILRQYFRLPSDIDLRNDPIFLSWTPIDDQHRREWLNQQIKETDSDTLRDLFPAFERLFRE